MENKLRGDSETKRTAPVQPMPQSQPRAQVHWLLLLTLTLAFALVFVQKLLELS